MSDDVGEQLVLELVGGGPPTELPQTGVLVIGSSPERAGFVLEGQGVADVHCAIGRASGGGWAIKDLGTDFGVFVNGKKVKAARLKAGDQILVGSRRLVVQLAGATPIVALAPRGGGRADAAERPAPAASPGTGSSSSALPAPRGPDAGAAQNGEQSLSRSQIGPPPRVGGYRVQRLLGRGAQGNVYLAEQESLARQVALKVLSAQVERDGSFVRRFQAEARAAAALNHPNIVTIHDVGQSEGHHYLSMEYMDAGSLEERVAQEGPLPWRVVVEVLLDAAAGLMYAESRGIVHRDIKPANLMQNAAGTTKIADLGLASHADAEAEVATEGGRKIFGTPHFIAPEQVRGERADRRADLYSLGATAYRLLTGRTPFDGQSTRDILRALLRDEPRPIAELVPGVPPELAATVTRLMSKDPADRHDSAAELLAELQALQLRDQQGLGSAPAAAGARRGTGLLLIGLVAMAAVGTGLFLLSGDEPESRNTDLPPADPVAIPAPPGPRGLDELAGTLIEEPAPEEEAQPDADALLAKLEADAQAEFDAIEQAALTPPERLERLGRLASSHAGTAAATRAQLEVDHARAEMERAAAEEAARMASIDALLDRTRAEAGLDERPLDVGEAFRAFAAIDGLAELLTDELFARRLAALEAEAVRIGSEETASTLEHTEQLMARGEFEAAHAELDGLRRRLDLPELEPAVAPHGWEHLLELRATARRRLEQFEHMRSLALAELGRKDAARLASELRGPDGLESFLARVDLAAAEALLARLAEGLQTDEARALVQSLHADVRLAAAAVRTLHQSYGEWRRLSIADPRDRRGSTREARGANAQGVLIEGGELIPWPAFAGRCRELHTLFHERLPRAWTPAEQQGICALLRLQGVVEASRVAAQMFDPAEQAVFTEREASELPAAFSFAREWAPDELARRRVEEERDAAQLLGESLRHASTESWPRATAGLERLLDRYGDTLLVRFLSDGRALAPTPVVADEVQEEAGEDPAGVESAGSEGARGSDETGGTGGNARR